MTPKNPNNRDNILDTAARLFAQNGFDATTMSSLAKEASVNKALIYYYFKDKDDILNSLFELLVTRMRRYAGTDSIDTRKNISITKKIDSEIDFLQENQNTLSLLLMESLKGGGKSKLLVEIARKEIERELMNRGFPETPKNAQERAKHAEAMVHEFFTGILPVLAYVSLGDAFAQQLNIKPAQCRKLFLAAFQNSHLNSHVTPDG